MIAPEALAESSNHPEHDSFAWMEEMEGKRCSFTTPFLDLTTVTTDSKATGEQDSFLWLADLNRETIPPQTSTKTVLAQSISLLASSEANQPSVHHSQDDLNESGII